MRSSHIKIEERDVELYLSTRALMNISERCGGNASALSEWLAEGTEIERLEKIGAVIGDLANGAIIRHNADIALGLEQGEKKLLYPDGYFTDVLSPGDFIVYQNEIYAAMGLGYAFEVPDGVKVEEEDADMAEILAEKEKNSPGV